MRKQKLGELNIAQSHAADICIQYKSPGSLHSARTEMHLEKLEVTDRRVGSAYSNSVFMQSKGSHAPVVQYPKSSDTTPKLWRPKIPVETVRIEKQGKLGDKNKVISWNKEVTPRKSHRKKAFTKLWDSN